MNTQSVTVQNKEIRINKVLVAINNQAAFTLYCL